MNDRSRLVANWSGPALVQTGPVTSLDRGFALVWSYMGLVRSF